VRIIISDISDLPIQASDELKTPDSAAKLHHCIGCFGCWVKTPGQCVIKDEYTNMGQLLGGCNDLTLVSKCTYGGFSPYVKNVLDRSVPYISPYFVYRNKEMHHKSRYDNTIGISAYFYGADITEKEKETAIRIVSANALNFNAKVNGVYFYNSPAEVKEAFVTRGLTPSIENKNFVSTFSRSENIPQLNIQHSALNTWAAKQTIALINASPKKAESASGALLNDLKSAFASEHNVKEFTLNKSSISETEIKELQEFSTWVFAFPLFVDGIPSHLLSCLCQIEEKMSAGETTQVYIIVNCGFFEGQQTRNALAIMENWCIKAGLAWGMGIGFGGGPALVGMGNVPLGKGPKSNLGEAYTVFTDAILSQSSKENIYTSLTFPRFLYKFMSEIGWKSLIKKNGGKIKDLKKKLEER
jgi:multimeric flavodoxin WrbA